MIYKKEADQSDLLYNLNLKNFIVTLYVLH